MSKSKSHRKNRAQASDITDASQQPLDERVYADKSRSSIDRQESFAATSPLSTVDAIAQVEAIVRDRAEDAEVRAAALLSISAQIARSYELIALLLSLLRDTTEPAVVRLAALRVAQLLGFTSAIFATVRPEYMDALRGAVESDNEELCQQALEILALDKDEYAQRRLIEGLRDPSKQLVPPEKAIQLLGYDMHAEHFPLLREIVRKPPNAAAKQQALRLLGADPESKDLLVSILNDKKQTQKVRAISAVALQSIAPDTLEQQARRIVLDETEPANLHAAALNLLTNSGDSAAQSRDNELNTQVEKLRGVTDSKSLKRAAANYMSTQSSEPE